MSTSGSQQLFSTNVSADLNTALEARTKDPLWYLARQWQLGEFEAETGGLPMQVHVEARIYPLETCRVGGRSVDVSAHAPLEYLVESEPTGPTVRPDGWKPSALEYGFSLSTDRHKMEARGYDGRAMDWHDFSLTLQGGSPGEEQRLEMVPGQLQIRGVPEPRFWEIEDREAYFDSGEGAEPNILSLLLPEFFYTDMKNWYTIPAPMPSGAVREIQDVRVVDSFGVVSSVDPVGARSAPRDDPWSIYAMDLGDEERTNSSTLLCLNTAARVGENDLIEEVRFLRDEAANLVWGWERQLTGSDGLFATVLEPGEAIHADEADALASTADLRFRLKSETARSFIPYLPRQTAGVPAVDGDIALRRARSSEAYSSKNPQYRGEIVAESLYLNEEDVPRSGVRVRRLHRFARGSDDEVYFWIGRDRNIAGPTKKPKLTFDDFLPVTADK
ncbi:hypothetical protein Q5Y75_23715 [Ruegeria sp. 2205SS24-7]|uniref:hypothetical protein n=1 Tax=Ruegeria discodermiae TaxID=3064389 RepID=UPI0027414981|nr:hypothetical protein [Ruegeria sp. 2205SS24-7]MDP5220203.1 hypothetical protein [Ruegeria sp. 2205SS24-7]